MSYISAISSKDSLFSPSPSFPFSFFSFISPTVRKTPPGEAAFWAWWFPQGRPAFALYSPCPRCCSRTVGRWSAGGAIFRVRMDAHEEAQQRAVAEDELARSALRQAEIERRIAEAQQKLKDRELARKGRRGRMTVHEQAIENNLNALLVRLRRGYLPGEVMSTPSAPPAEVFASAQQHVQHHAAGGAAPAGRPAPKAGGSADGADDDGGGGGEEDAAFRNYSSPTLHQRSARFRVNWCQDVRRT